jgi:hypothetical protein
MNFNEYYFKFVYQKDIDLRQEEVQLNTNIRTIFKTSALAADNDCTLSSLKCIRRVKVC